MRGSPLLLSLVESQRLHNKVMGSHLAPRDSDDDRQLFSCGAHAKHDVIAKAHIKVGTHTKIARKWRDS